MSTSAEPRARRVPGEEGVWVFILGDMSVFALIFGAFLYERGQQPEVFAASLRELDVAFGAVNTVVLLTSSLFVALAVQAYRRRAARAATRLVTGAICCALLFITLKGFEWSQLLRAGLDPSTNHFFTYYFAITGLHLLHLCLGLGGLLFLRRVIRRATSEQRDTLIVEAGASYWHMVDLLWVVIFPLVYFSAT